MGLRETCNQEKEEVYRLKKVVECEHQKALTQHERLVNQHMNNVRSICRRADTAEKTFAAVEQRLQAVHEFQVFTDK